ncbi:hypothetical protein POUND7_001698 [Theobroma cacao]
MVRSPGDQEEYGTKHGTSHEIMSRFPNERIEESKLVKEKTTNDFLDVLLKYEETTGSTIEWAMAKLLRNTESKTKAK